MWNCKKCNHLMEDDAFMCIDCGCPKQDIGINKQDFIVEDIDTFSNTDDSNQRGIKLVVTSKKEEKKWNKKNKAKNKKHNALMNIESNRKVKLKKISKKIAEKHKFHLRVNDSPINSMNVLKAIGYVSIIIYAVAGVILGNVIDTGTEELFNWMVSTACWTMGAITSIMFFILSDIAKSIRDLVRED